MEIVLRTFATRRKLSMVVDSCGTADYHEGDHPYSQSIRHAKLRGYDMSKLIGRQITKRDFDHFDLLLCADKSNYANVLKICPEEAKEKVKMAVEYLPETSRYNGADQIPDPWGGPSKDYEVVLDMTEDIMTNLCDIIEQHSKQENN